MAQQNLHLIAGDSTYKDFEGKCPNVNEKGFVKATVYGGIWILYQYTEYNKAAAQSQESNIVIIKNPVQDQKLPWSPMSVYRCEDARDSCTVFEHFYYGGFRKQYQEASFDITKDFPLGKIQGASSLIVWPNKDWELFTKPDFKGKHNNVRDGWFPTSHAMNFPNDSLASLRPL